jgi:hypothetical protein
MKQNSRGHGLISEMQGIDNSFEEHEDCYYVVCQIVFEYL